MCLILAPIKNEPASIITEPESITEPAPNITKPITVLKQLLLMLQIFTNVSSHPMIRDPMRCECIICIIEAGSFFIGASSVIDPSTNEEGALKKICPKSKRKCSSTSTKTFLFSFFNCR